MTQKEKKQHYESLVNSQQIIESSMHRSLAEQFTVEIVLRTITKFDHAIEWIQSTFMFNRIIRNPKYYGSAITQGEYAEAYPYI